MKFIWASAIVFLVLILTACGGGRGSKLAMAPIEPPSPPVIEPVEPEVVEPVEPEVSEPREPVEPPPPPPVIEPMEPEVSEPREPVEPPPPPPPLPPPPPPPPPPMMMDPTEPEDTPSGFLNEEASLVADAIPGDLIHDGVSPAFFGGYQTAGGLVSLMNPDPDNEPVLQTGGFTVLHDWNRTLQGARYTRVPHDNDHVKDTIIVYSNKASNNTDYLDFGYWISRSGGDPVRYGVDPFVFGSQESIGNSLNELTGYATYSGPATGIYVKKSASVYDEVGQFTANTLLTARFNVVSPITDMNHPLYECKLLLSSVAQRLISET